LFVQTAKLLIVALQGISEMITVNRWS